DQRQLDQDHEAQCKQQEEASRQRRLSLLRRLAKLADQADADTEETRTEELKPKATTSDCLSLLTAGGVPLLAELAHEASADGLDLEAAGSKAVAPELQNAQAVVRQLRELL
ncbi:unnamed protein product, partial [Symbiodinium pilosum]